GSGASVQHLTEFLIAVPGPNGVDGLGGLGLGAQARHSLGGEGPQGVADGLHTTAEDWSDLGRPIAPRARQQDLAPPQGKGMGRGEARLQLLPVFGRQRNHKRRRLHRVGTPGLKGNKEAGAVPSRAARQQLVRYSSTLWPCWRRVAALCRSSWHSQ